VGGAGNTGAADAEGMRAVVRRVKYNCRSWGNCDFAVGFSAAVPVAGSGKAYGLLWMELGFQG
jgi:hypothetical protein